MPNLPHDDDSDDLIDVRSMFSDEAAPAKPPPVPAPAPTPSPSNAGEYELGGEDPDEGPGAPTPPPIAKKRSARPIGGVGDVGEAPPVPRAPVAPKRSAPPTDDFDDFDEAPRPTKRARRDPDEGPPSRSDDESGVDEIWTRWGEWGSTLILLGVATLVVLGLTYWIGSNISVGVAFLVLVVGFVAVVLLSYPIAVTLERPIRMTPEQAIKDFYAAASHHFPQYRRMWALLSTNGRTSREFDSFATFRSYWQHRMTRLRGGKIGGLKPLQFDVKEFRGDKSAGQTSVDIEYTVHVRKRDAEGPPLEEVRIETTSVKGPDNMWYLDLGSLPETRRSNK